MAAQADADSDEAGFYFFIDHPDQYESWLGIDSLPKLDHRNAEMRRRYYEGPDSVFGRYLRAPFDMAGWRIDVANMTGRYGAVDRNREVAEAVRSAVSAERPDAYLVGEHFHDFMPDLDGAGWQGVMNYAGFTKPIWSWLTTGELPLDNWMGIPWPGWPRLPGWSVAATMQQFAAVGWQHRAASMNIISSHDSPRIRTVTGDPALVEVAAAAMFTMPGVPMIWSGDEVGIEGVSGEDGRRPFPWHRPDHWASATLRAYRRLAQLRGRSQALQRGGLRWLFSDDDRLVFVRETPSESVLVLLARAPGPAIHIPSAALGLQDGQDFESLYPVSAHPASHPRHLPGAGPGVWIWRWSRSRRAHQE